MMGRLEEFKGNKAYILQDLLDPITYTPDRNHDIYTMMHSYLADETDATDKEEILKNLVNCIEGRVYEQPDAIARDYYSKEDVDAVAATMDAFIDGLIEGCAEGHLPPAQKLTDAAWGKINALDEKSNGCLLDTWRREEIHNWMVDACKASIYEALENKNSMGGMQML